MSPNLVRLFQIPVNSYYFEFFLSDFEGLDTFPANSPAAARRLNSAIAARET